ncbi:tetratricopeptide repeat protein [Streptomyces sp. NPDC127197]|uniref:tetratricopeptide repeat protein n=1 Tax=Streptomyces sp. NPDC127197 TaxID=3345388 RepID=UPI00362BEFA1
MTNLVTSTWNWWLFGALLVLVSLAAVGAALVPGSSPVAEDSAQVEASDGHSGGPSTLPAGTAVFAGRESELDRILNAEPPAAGPRPLVCLVTGPKGSGKTELAVQAAHRLAVRYPSGQLFVGYRSNAGSAGRLFAEDALAAVLAAVGVAAGTTHFDADAMTRQWLSTASNRLFLMVLDDVDQADQVGPLLPSSPRSMVIVTSLTMLTGLDADVHVELDALSEEAARSVVTAILRRGSRTVDDTVIDAAVALYRLPLTIRHIADRLVAQQTPLALCAEPDVPARGEGTAPILAAIEALTPMGHLVFRRMALHPGPHVTDEIAAELADVPVREAESALALLHEQGLIIKPDPHGYGLHDLVRSLAHRDGSRRDASGTWEQARVRLFKWAARRLAWANTAIHAPLFLELPDLDTGEPEAAMTEEQVLEWLHHHFEDLRSVARLANAHRWLESWKVTAGLAYFMRVRKRNIAQAIALNEAALGIAQASDDAGRAHCQAQLGALHRVSGRYREALDMAGAATNTFRQLGDRRNEAYAASEVGVNRYHLADYTCARRTMDHARELHEIEGQQRGKANALGVLGMISRATGDYQEARGHLTEALDIYRGIGNARNEAWILIELGTIDRLTGELHSAGERFTAALTINTRVKDRSGCAWAQREIGILKRILGLYDEARTLLHEAWDEFTALDSERNIADAEVELCSLHRALGELGTARQYGDSARQRYERMGNSRGSAWTKAELGALDVAEGDFPAAERRLEEARTIYVEIGDPSGEARAHLELGRLKLARGQQAAARQYLERAQDLYTALGEPQADQVRSLLDGG